MKFEEIVEYIKSELGANVVLELIENATPKGFVTNTDRLISVMQFLHSDEQLYFDSLSCLTGLDNGPEEGTVEVIYNLYSIPFDHHLMIKVQVDRDQAEVPTVSGVWKTADWQEREAYDLVGINFNGHPDLRRILMPADWQGNPLRKDYEEQEFYHGIKLEE